jgi:hypothetical protein
LCRGILEQRSVREINARLRQIRGAIFQELHYSELNTLQNSIWSWMCAQSWHQATACEWDQAKLIFNGEEFLHVDHATWRLDALQVTQNWCVNLSGTTCILRKPIATARFRFHPQQQLPEIPLTGPDHSQVFPSCVDVFCNILISCHVLMLFVVSNTNVVVRAWIVEHVLVPIHMRISCGPLWSWSRRLGLHIEMEWQVNYLDAILIPLSLVIQISYHAILFHRVRHTPLRTVIGFNQIARRLWVYSMMKVSK